MAISYQSKDSAVLGRQLKTQKVSIPLTIVGNATPASVSVSSGEPAVMFVRTQGIDQITGALASGETATFGSAPNDLGGIFNVLIDVKEPVSSIVSIRLVDLVSGTAHGAKLGSSTGITVGGTSKMMLVCTSAVALNAANTLQGAVEVEYVLNK